MTELATKKQLLDEAGYIYSLDREVYFHPKDHKVFSVEFIEDHQPEVIAEKIREAKPADEWRFIFNDDPSDWLKRELARVLS